MLARQAVTVVDSAHGGNNSGLLDPDETADLMVRIGNSGLGHGYNCHAVLRSGDARLTVVDSMRLWLPQGDSASNAADLFTVHAGGTIFPETPIPCTLHYYADGGYVESEPFIIVVGEMRATDPIPDGPRTPVRYYAYDDVDVAYSPHPTYDWVEVNSLGTQVSFPNNNSVIPVSLPPEFGPFKFYGQSYTQIAISADGWVAPGNRTTPNYENVALPDPMDPAGMICANWVDLYPVSGGGGAGNVYYYHDTASHRFIVEYDSVRYYWDNRRDKFEIIIYDTTVATHTGDNAVLVQYMTANGYAGSTVGIEDPGETVAIQALYNSTYHRASAPIAAGRAVLYTTDPPFPVGVADERGPAGVPVKLTLSAHPNPVRSRVSIAWALPVAGRVSVRVYDAAGRVVRELAGNEMAAGRYALTWDARAANGSRVADGVYFCQLTTPAGARQQKLVVARR